MVWSRDPVSSGVSSCSLPTTQPLRSSIEPASAAILTHNRRRINCYLMLRRISLAIWCILFALAALSLAAALTVAAMWIRAQFAYERVGITFASPWPNHGYRKFGVMLDFGTNEIWMLDRLWVEDDPSHAGDLWQQSPHHWYASRVNTGPPRPIVGVGVFPQRGSWFNFLGFECATDTTASHYDYPGWQISHGQQFEIWDPQERQL